MGRHGAGDRGALLLTARIRCINCSVGKKAAFTEEGDKPMRYSKPANISQNQATASHVSFLTQ